MVTIQYFSPDYSISARKNPLLTFLHSPLCSEKGFPIVLIPWVVLQEMDSLKKGKGLSVSSVAHLAIPAISYVLNSLKSREPHLWGQSMQQASQSNSECIKTLDDTI